MDFKTDWAYWRTALQHFAVLEELPIPLPRVVCMTGGKALAPQPLGPGGLWPDPEADELRLQCESDVPWADPRIELDVDGEGLLEVDGVSRAASNAYHRQADLRLPPGRHLLSLEVLRTGLMGMKVASPRLRLSWQRVDRVAEAAAWDLAVLAEWALDPGTPPAAAALAREGVTDALRPLRALPPDPGVLRSWLGRSAPVAEEEGLRLALLRDDLPALQPLDRELVDAAVRETARALRELFGRLRAALPPGVGEAALLGHAHIDLAWLWDMPTARRKARRTYATQAELLAAYPEWRMGISQPELWQALREDDPDLLRRLEEFARAGRVEPLGATWVEIDGQLPDAESVLRQLTYGLGYFAARLGTRPETAFLPDSFGFAAGLPTLLAAAGVRHFCTTKLTWNDTTRFPYPDFTWVGPDGGAVQGHLFSASEGGYDAPATLRDLRATAERHEQAGGRGPFLYTFGYGDGGGGPTAGMLERLRRYAELPLMPRLAWQGVADAVAQDGPPYRGPLYLEYHRGTYTSQTWAKYLLARTEAQLAASDARSAWAHGGRERPTADWRRLLRLQFHDILPGSSIAPVYEQLRHELREVLQRAVEADRAALAALDGDAVRRPCLVLGSRAGFASGPSLALVPQPVAPAAGDGAAELQAVDGGFLVEIPALPPFGAAALPVRAVEPPAAQSASPCDQVALAGGDVELMAGPAGIESLRYRGQEMLAETAGVEAYRQHPDHWDAWEVVPPGLRVPIALRHGRPLRVESGPLRDAVLLRHRGPEGLEVQERILLERRSGRLTVAVRAKVPGRRVVLRYALPTVLRAAAVTAEDMWGTWTHPVVAGGPADEARFEWPAQRFVDLGEPHLGMALCCGGRYGHAVSGGTLYLTLSTAPLYPDPHADEDPAPAVLEILPHEGDWRDAGVLARAHVHAAGVRAELRDAAPMPPTGPCLGLPPNVRLLALKGAEDHSGDVVVHLGELWGDRGTCDLTFPWPISAALPCDLVSEEPLPGAGDLRSPDAPDRVRLSYLPYQPILLRLRRS